LTSPELRIDLVLIPLASPDSRTLIFHPNQGPQRRTAASGCLILQTAFIGSQWLVISSKSRAAAENGSQWLLDSPNSLYRQPVVSDFIQIKGRSGERQPVVA